MDTWYGVVNRQPLILNLNKDRSLLKIQSNSSEFLDEDLENGVISYLGLNDSLESIKGAALKKLKENWPEFVTTYEHIMDTNIGIRILRQDPWEMLVEYLLSTQSSIATIQKRSEALARLFPENKTYIGQEPFFLFPTLDQLKHLEEEDFRSMSFGYRAKWLKELIDKINMNQFLAIRNATLEQKLNYLTQFSGIGYKVANCVALFGFSEFKAFPVDVWISRFLEEFFDITGSSQKLMYVGQQIFGDYCGYIQEYIFYYIRNREP